MYNCSKETCLGTVLCESVWVIVHASIPLTHQSVNLLHSELPWWWLLLEPLMKAHHKTCSWWWTVQAKNSTAALCSHGCQGPWIMLKGCTTKHQSYDDEQWFQGAACHSTHEDYFNRLYYFTHIYSSKPRIFKYSDKHTKVFMLYVNYK